ncbi:uncharacterized protein BYT42DRAFT_574904 [Radiomyces spectabilis]|uniref:uncharacterized protein n=1 Tax=Radiomyces spectabilis TaxID=64574 RepID=UPI002220B1C6|nr:uncharacterized protein BYT42DRAFT_574904 [Radiomyces spectabilis]KAI8376516.1 hypothetical protein BYT42DRAFT_574904 [Radiomyces spectabilis]
MLDFLSENRLVQLVWRIAKRSPGSRRPSIQANPEELTPPLTKRQKRWQSFKYPSGVKPQHAAIVRWLGRIGFVAKGIVYSVMGGLCIATAQDLSTEVKAESPMGAFLFLGLFEIGGTPILIAMFVGILFYAIWRFWEGSTGQGSDRTMSVFQNFFRYRLSPIVSGIVYVVYLVVIGELLSESMEERHLRTTSQVTGCFPTCWAQGDWIHQMAVAVFGIAFVIAFVTQIQNGFSGRWYRDLMLHHCTRFEKYFVYMLGHLGFLARAGVFMFVAVYMFRSLRQPMVPERDPFSDAINQIISVHGGKVGLWFLGIGLIMFGLFAALNAYYKYYPTAPPSRLAFSRPTTTSSSPTSADEISLPPLAAPSSHSNNRVAPAHVTDRPPSPWLQTRRARRYQKPDINDSMA